MNNSAFLTLGDQLFDPLLLKSFGSTHVVMAEDHGLCTSERHHKQKLVFFLSAMREYADELRQAGYRVTYYDVTHPLFRVPFEEKLRDFFSHNPGVTRLTSFEISDRFFKERLRTFTASHGITFSEVRTPGFLCDRETFASYLDSTKRPFMKTFYERERKRLGVLTTSTGEPIGGRWSFDEENRNRFDKDIRTPPLRPFELRPHTRDVSTLVDTLFSDHPGDTRNFWIPTTRAGAREQLQRFLHDRLRNFGRYQDAMSPEHPFGFHSLLSPLLNSGLLTPEEVLRATLDYVSPKTDVPLASLEGFIRQLIGWREFVRGVYDHFDVQQKQSNFWNHKRKLSQAWYKGETGIPPLDDSIKKAQEFGYCHHIERLMVQSNLMLLCEIDPLDAHRWFMEMYVDSADWVMGPNVFGMGLMSDGGIFATKPYICGSNYLLKMSSYKKGEWCDIVDGLYWRFIAKQTEYFRKQPRLSMTVKTLQKMDKKRKEKIFLAADSFIARVTTA